MGVTNHKDRLNQGVPYGKQINLNQQRTAFKKIRRHVQYELRLPLVSLKKNAIVKAFADYYGYTIDCQTSIWVQKLYLSGEDEICKRQDTAFYSTHEWKSLRRRVLVAYHNSCMKCGDTGNLHVDHIKPRSLYPELELSFNNMQVLCRICNIVKSNRNEIDYRVRCED